jgi:tetratricopeptide (TPR) repeat protein
VDPTDSYSAVTGFKLFPFWDYLIVQLTNYLLYARLLIDSSLQSLVHEYPKNISDEIFIEAFFGFVFISSTVLSVLYFLRKRHYAVSFLFLVTCLVLLPTNSILQMINPFAEYRLYSANLFFFFALSSGFAALLDCGVRSFLLRAVCVLLLTAIVVFSSARTQDIWKKNISILSHSLDGYPESRLMLQMLGYEYEAAKNYDAALENYLKAESIWNAESSARLNDPKELTLGVLMLMGRFPEALAKLKEIETAWGEKHVASNQSLVIKKSFLLGWFLNQAEYLKFSDLVKRTSPNLTIPNWATVTQRNILSPK